MNCLNSSGMAIAVVTTGGAIAIPFASIPHMLFSLSYANLGSTVPEDSACRGGSGV